MKFVNKIITSQKNIHNKKIFYNLRFLFFFGFSMLIMDELFSFEKTEKIRKLIKNDNLLSTVNWQKINFKQQNKNKINWNKINNVGEIKKFDEANFQKKIKDPNGFTIGSFNRSIVFNNSIVGPDINWLIPPGFKWNSKFKFDSSVRGNSRRKKGQKFLGWNEGDAVGQFYYQFIHNSKSSLGLNFGVRSVYQGSAIGGETAIGEGTSLGFRTDFQISPTAGIAFGAEQLLHFDGLTDTGRDIYLTLSKGFWNKKVEGDLPLTIYTLGLGTGKMAEGNVKGLCSNLFGGSGTEIKHQRSLCWAPIFSISKIYNEKFSAFFEYNSKFFLLGTSFVPINNIPLRGTFAIQLSDHIDNYKLNNLEELKWVFRLSLGI